MVVYLKASTNEKTYSSYLWAVREAEEEEAMEPSHNQKAVNQNKPKAMSFFPLWKLKGNQPAKIPAVWVMHLEESTESDNPKGIEGMMEGFIVCLAQAVKEAHQDEKCCYHFSSPEHFIHECPLVKTSRSATHLNQKKGMALEKGTKISEVKVTKPKAPPEGMSKA